MIRSKFNEKTAKKTNCVTRRRTHELTRRKNVANESDPADRTGLHLRQFDFCVLGDATGCFGRQLSAIENGNRFGSVYCFRRREVDYSQREVRRSVGTAGAF